LSIDPDAVPKYSSQAACKAAGISAATLGNWLSRKPPAVLLAEEERENVRRGTRLLLSFNRVLQLALMTELVDHGFTARNAAEITWRFSDLTKASEGSGWSSDETPEEIAKRLRMPGKLYPTGLTVLLAYKDLLLGRLINVRDGMPFESIFSPDDRRQIESVAVVWVNPIHSRVRLALDAFEQASTEIPQQVRQEAL
jgi:hypothetical protein